MLLLVVAVVTAPAPVDRVAANEVLSVPSPAASAAAPAPAPALELASSVPLDMQVPAAAPPASRSRAALMRDKLNFFPYGWVRTDATYYSAEREGYSNISLAGARLGGGVTAGPVTVFVTIEAGAAKGPQLFDAFVLWDVVPRLSVRAGQFKAPFGYCFNAPDFVDELPHAPLSMLAAPPGRQVGLELTYDFWRYAQVFAAAFSGIGQNREANNTKVAFAGKIQLRPLAFAPRLPQLTTIAPAHHLRQRPAVHRRRRQALHRHHRHDPRPNRSLLTEITSSPTFCTATPSNRPSISCSSPPGGGSAPDFLLDCALVYHPRT